MQKSEIISKLKIDNLPPEQQDEIIQRLENIIQRKIALEIANALKGQNIPETGTDTETLKILRSKIPNFDALIKNVAVKTIDDFIGKIS